METIVTMVLMLSFIPVSTLPIRNGNINHNGTLGEARLTPNATPKSKYLTYKEWKLRLICLFCRRLILVSTLPIRNGNYLFYFVPGATPISVST